VRCGAVHVMHMAHIVREMRGVALTDNGFFFYSKLGFSASAAHGLSHTPHRRWQFQRLKIGFSFSPPAKIRQNKRTRGKTAIEIFVDFCRFFS
jgi:hypothetical protein